ncbi:hypothetical protein EVAR_29929_1 [Eumeta japonica]|uniref:Uncharacterized protein n=1 Tax=Eumeta variegata TaxID=151549 RepID=A0A4C1V8A2_EUMVA|nr:hypothetical protein EVAR_29929_1 [Eumeta japonica]
MALLDIRIPIQGSRSKAYALLPTSRPWRGLSSQRCGPCDAHAPFPLPSTGPDPQHGKLFPDIGISMKVARPSATLLAPQREGGGPREAKVLRELLRTQRRQRRFPTFSYILKWRCGEKSRV